MARPIVIDTDPGQDDAVAILMALAAPELEVLGITTVAGNVPQPLVTENTLRLLTLAGRTDVPVYAGCTGPMVRALYTAEYVHGPTGIDGAGFPAPAAEPRPEHGVDYLVDTLLAADDGSITLCPLGPLTNIATAIVKEPRIVTKIREIVLMGGAFTGGNTTPVAEFNIFVDPHAARIVFESGAPITMMPLDVTHKAIVEPRHLERLAAIGTAVADAVAGMLSFYVRFDVERYGMTGGPLHDPTVIGYLLHPELFAGKHVAVAVEADSELTMGQTVGDFWGMTDRTPNALVITDVENEAFQDLVASLIARL